MAEADQRHRISMDREAQAADIAHREQIALQQAGNARAIFRSDLVGQILGGIIALCALGGGIYSIVIGAPWQATAAFLALPVAAIIKALRDSFLTKRETRA